MDDVTERALRHRIDAERRYGKREILDGAELLIVRLRQAIRDVDFGKSINPHLIANFSMLTEAIARWNTALDLMPFLDFDDKGKKEKSQ